MTGHNRAEKVIPLSDAARRYLETQTTAEMLEGIQRARYDRRLDRIGECFDKPPPRRLHQADGGHLVVAGVARPLPVIRDLRASPAVLRTLCRLVPALIPAVRRAT